MNKQLKCLGVINLFSLFLDVLNLLTLDTNIYHISINAESILIQCKIQLFHKVKSLGLTIDEFFS